MKNDVKIHNKYFKNINEYFKWSIKKEKLIKEKFLDLENKFNIHLEYIYK